MKASPPIFLGAESYGTYPHCNAFTSGDKAFIYAQFHEGVLSLHSLDLATQTTSHLADLGAKSSRPRSASHDVALEAGIVAVVFENSARILNLEGLGGWIEVYRPEGDARLDGLCSISSDGGRLLCGERRGEVCRAIEIDLGRGTVRELFSKNWYANHFHYCPHDNGWVAFSHEGPTESIPDRCWVWHAHHAPLGRVVFDQASEKPGILLCVGHERWCFHDVSAYVPAYAMSPAGKRGLYEIFGDNRPARLLWESDVVWHCNMDRSGRFVVLDTTGPFTETMLDAEAFVLYRDRHLQADRDKTSNASDVVVLDLQTREILRLATVTRTHHPYHPHPALSPRAGWVAWNESAEPNRGVWLAALDLGSDQERATLHKTNT